MSLLPRRHVAVPLCLALLAAGLLTGPLGAPAAAATAERVAGAERYETAAKLALRAPRASGRVWLATGADYPDALSAAAVGEPVVLVRPGDVPAASASALRTIDPAEVVAVGGPRVIGDATLASAGRHASARTARVAGPDRFATAVAVSQRVHRAGSGVVWLATGLGFADALSAGPLAAAEDAPLLLVWPDRLTPEVRAELARLAPEEIVVVGGRGVVHDTTAAEAAQAAGGASVTRLSGGDRFSTAAAVADRAKARHGFGANAYLATGHNFPDAIAAGPAAGAAKAPLLLATRTSVEEPTRQALLRLANQRVTVIGGESVLSRTVLHRAARPHLVGACDLYDATDPSPIQGHPEGLRGTLNAWSGPWVVDNFRQSWGIAVPYRWRVDKVEAFEHRGVLFYVDTENGYDHWFSVTIFCGNPFLVGGGVALSPKDPQGIAARGPHSGLGEPEFERFGGPAIYTAAWFGDTESQRYDYVAVNDDVILIHYRGTNRFARDLPGSIGALADRVSASVGPAAAVQCPPNASQCLRR